MRARFPLVLALGLCACSGGALKPVAPGSQDSGVTDAAAEASIALSDGSVDVDVAPATCAEETHVAMRVPLDVFLLLDASNSMNEPAGSKTKHQVVRAALRSFLQDPLSLGLGVGLTFFPAVTTCQGNGDCPADGSLPGRCAVTPDTSCVSSQGVVGAGCDGATMCPAGETCRQIGQCQDGLGPGMTSPRCALGMACPDGTACQAVQHVCLGPRSDCSGAHYAKPAVGFADLPAALPGLAAALGARQPAGGTPLPEALTGTLALLRAHLGAHADHKAVLVVASDGVPDATCAGAPGVLSAIAGAQTAAPSIATYAIGVFSGDLAAEGRAFMTDVAKAGGTTSPFVLEANAGLGDSFLAALNAIRGAALPCEYVIPPNDAGTIDFGKVNVRARAGGRDQLIGYVNAAENCTADKGGWHYDLDPRSATPKRIALCPSTCQTWKATARAEVEIRFGCKTTVIE
jgi:Mg-chelatase subunit ChlD